MQDIANNLILDRYQVIETAGVGGYGTVLHAYDTRLKREVAIKRVSIANRDSEASDDVPGMPAYIPGTASQDSQPDSTHSIPGLEEARAAGKLSSENIVTIYDCVVEDDTAYVIEEFVEGVTLTTLMRILKDEINLDIIAHIFKSVATAIMTAHKENILHLDIKPDNVLVGRGGDVKVADFGLATLMDVNGEGSAAAGTIGYMPLEQMKKQPLDVRSDEWSLAMIVYEMLTGSNPFARAQSLSQAEILMLDSEMLVPSVCWEDLPEEVDDVLFRALSVDMDSRYKNVKDFMSALKPLLGDSKLGKRELAVLVNGNADNLIATSTINIDESNEDVRRIGPFVDRLGSRGAKIIARILDCAAVAMIAAIAFLNVNIDYAALTGVDSHDLALAIVVGVTTLVTAIKPKWGLIASLALFAIMLFLNQAWIVGLAVLVFGALWSGFVGINSSGSCFCLLLEPLFGSIGLGALSPVMAGATQNVLRASLTSLFAAILAVVFASLGSTDMLNWDIFHYATQPLTAEVVGQKLNNAFVLMVQNPRTWIMLASWVLASALFSLFCMKGSKSFDIAGSILCAIALLAGTICAQALFGGAISPNSLAQTVAAGAIGICAATFLLTDRVRLEEGLW